jgi:radical SAM superfamily enzyme YgiQ (UPF0313 family)
MQVTKSPDPSMDRPAARSQPDARKALEETPAIEHLISSQGRRALVALPISRENRVIGLLSLSTADYSQVECLTKEMARAFSKDNVSISLPSLRADMFSVSLAENVGEVRKNGFTFAPEAGSVRMRKFINKNISNEELFQAIETAYRQGWNLIKLYFMIGLPTETDQDIRELVDLIREVGKIDRLGVKHAVAIVEMIHGVMISPGSGRG